MSTQTPEAESQASQSSSKVSPLRRPKVRLGAIVASAALIGLAIWILVASRGSDSQSTSDNNRAVAVSPRGLQTLSGALGQPIYWLGTSPDTTYELSQTPDRRIYVRYLPAGVKVGDPGTFRTVGTYPMRNAFAVTKAAAAQPGAVKIPMGGGGVATYNTSKPTNIYVAYPGVDYQIEVFDPSPSRARTLVAAQSIAPVR